MSEEGCYGKGSSFLFFSSSSAWGGAGDKWENYAFNLGALSVVYGETQSRATLSWNGTAMLLWQ